jgi:hypothetical protein
MLLLTTILNPGIFSDFAPFALCDYFLGLGLTVFMVMLPIVLAIMITQRS